MAGTRRRQTRRARRRRHLAAVRRTDLTDLEVATLGVQLLFAGHETTVMQIWLQSLLLLSHREQWQALLTSPDLIPKAVEELLRAGMPGGSAFPGTPARTSTSTASRSGPVTSSCSTPDRPTTTRRPSPTRTGSTWRAPAPPTWASAGPALLRRRRTRAHGAENRFLAVDSPRFPKYAAVRRRVHRGHRIPFAVARAGAAARHLVIGALQPGRRLTSDPRMARTDGGTGMAASQSGERSGSP